MRETSSPAPTSDAAALPGRVLGVPVAVTALLSALRTDFTWTGYLGEQSPSSENCQKCAGSQFSAHGVSRSVARCG